MAVSSTAIAAPTIRTSSRKVAETKQLNPCGTNALRARTLPRPFPHHHGWTSCREPIVLARGNPCAVSANGERWTRSRERTKGHPVCAGCDAGGPAADPQREDLRAD